MDLILDTKEQEILALTLTSAISELGDEIAHTEKYELRQDLKERKTLLREILGRLSEGEHPPMCFGRLEGSEFDAMKFGYGLPQVNGS